MTRLRARAILWAVLLILGCAAPSAAQYTVRKVLILNSFEREFAPYNDYAEMLRAELSRRSPMPITFFEVSLQLALTPERPRDEQIVQYLQSILIDQRLDLIVTVGGNAAAFVQKYRERLFPETPVLQGSLSSRRVPPSRPEDNSTAVATAEDFPRMIQNILDVLPGTDRVFVVIGASPFEAFWMREFTREFERFKSRLTFEWSNGMSVEQILARSSSLPPHSAIFYVTLLVDAKGAVQTDERVLAQLHAVANAPLFGQFDIHVGRGIVGGALTMIVDSSQSAADVALRILGGATPAQIKVPALAPGQPTYDWRELRRWGISEARLPPGSIVKFRPPSAWDQYKIYIVGAGTLVGLQTALIAGLFVQRTRRRRTEQALRESYARNQDLAGRLISAQEEERSRIARDLHDNLSQQVAGVSIMLSGLKRKVGKAGSEPNIDQTIAVLQDRAAGLAQSIRNLSHELHPSVLEHAGLVATLRRHCADVEALHRVAVIFNAEDPLDSLSPDVALCLFRVAQEAITNALSHGRASTIRVQLMVTTDVIELGVYDDGVGFVASGRTGNGLGLRGIDERVRLVSGHLAVNSRSGQGTTLLARIPLVSARVES